MEIGNFETAVTKSVDASTGSVRNRWICIIGFKSDLNTFGLRVNITHTLKAIRKSFEAPAFWLVYRHSP